MTAFARLLLIFTTIVVHLIQADGYWSNFLSNPYQHNRHERLNVDNERDIYRPQRRYLGTKYFDNINNNNNNDDDFVDLIVPRSMARFRLSKSQKQPPVPNEHKLTDAEDDEIIRRSMARFEISKQKDNNN